MAGKQLTEMAKVGVALEYIGSPKGIRTGHHPTALFVSANIGTVEPPIGVRQVLAAWLGPAVEVDTTANGGLHLKDIEIGLHEAGEGKTEEEEPMHGCRVYQKTSD